MKNKMRHPRSGTFMLLGVLTICLLLQGTIHVYREIDETKNDTGYAPAFVTYGTHSTATVPLVSAPRRTGVPMVSAAAVRHAAYAGHASVALAAGGIHTTSSAQVRTVGSGIGGSGAAAAITASSAQRGITYGGASVFVPVLAINTAVAASPALVAESSPRAAGPRRIPAAPGQWEQDGSGDWFIWDEGEWREAELGDTRTTGGVTYRYNGSGWDIVKDQTDPNLTAPVGTTPLLLLALLAALYTVRKKSRRA